MICRNLHQANLLEVGLMQIMEDHETLSIVSHVRLHVDFSSVDFCFAPLGLHPRMWSELGATSHTRL